MAARHFFLPEKVCFLVCSWRAMTIHASQGVGFTRPVHVDIANAFCTGLAYVALSRNVEELTLARPLLVEELQVISLPLQ
jgi:hypothetical protein